MKRFENINGEKPIVEVKEHSIPGSKHIILTFKNGYGASIIPEYHYPPKQKPMDSVKNSIVGDAAGGIADGIAGLKSSLEGLTDGIAAKVEAAIPEIPKPELKLQDEMNSLVAGLASGDPGAVLDKLGSMKDKFPGVNVDEMLKEVGVDADKLAIEKKKFDKIKQDALTTARITGQDIASGKGAALDSVSSKLLAVGSGDLSAVADIMGNIPSMTLPGFELSGIKDAICTCLLYTSPSPRDRQKSRMPSSA